MKYAFNETITYFVPADSLDEAESKMGEIDCSDYEVNRELEYIFTTKN